MAQLKHGRGKQSFRDFSKSLNELVNDIVNGQKEGQDYTANDVTRFVTQLTNEYFVELRGQELDVELWGDRAIDAAVNATEKIIDAFALQEEEQEEQESEIEYQDSQYNPEDTAGGTTLLGYDVVTGDNKAEVRDTSKPRKRFFTTIEELAEYVRRVPYITFIQILHNTNGKVIGYRVWVEASKDKRKRKSAS